MRPRTPPGRARAPRAGLALLWVFTLAAAGGSACADASQRDGVRTITRDSAGVEIAELVGDPWAEPTWASLDTSNVFRIEPDDGHPESLFGRIQDVLRLEDGRIAVIDSRRFQVFLFAADGLPLRTIGRRGQGPGEYRWPRRLLRRGADSIGVVDDSRIELFPLGAGDSRRVRLPPDAGRSVEPFGVLADGGYLTMATQNVVEPRVGQHILHAVIGAAAADGSARRMLGRHVSTTYAYGSGGTDGPIELMTLFWEDAAGGALPDGYVWCLSTHFECEVWSVDGGYLRSIRSAVKSPPVSDADVAELTASWLRGLRTAADSASTRAAISSAARMERMPAFSALRTDSHGRIWMRAYQPREGEQTVRWLVFESTGRVLGTATTPAGFDVFDIGTDYMLGVERDADDVQRVVMYRYMVTR